MDASDYELKKETNDLLFDIVKELREISKSLYTIANNT